MPIVMRIQSAINLLFAAMEHLLASLTKLSVLLVSVETRLPPPPTPHRIPRELLVCCFCDRVCDLGQGYVYSRWPICEDCTWKVAEEGGF